MINRTDLKRVRVCVYVAWHMALASPPLPCHLGLFLVRWTHLAKAPSRGASADKSIINLFSWSEFLEVLQLWALIVEIDRIPCINMESKVKRSH